MSEKLGSSISPDLSNQIKAREAKFGSATRDKATLEYLLFGSKTRSLGDTLFTLVESWNMNVPLYFRGPLMNTALFPSSSSDPK